MNGLNSFNKTDREYSLARTHDVQVIAGCRGQILWKQYLMNYLSNIDETYRE